MSSESSPVQHEGERGNTVDQVAELLMADEPAVDEDIKKEEAVHRPNCLLYTSPSPRDRTRSRMPSSA